MITPDIERLLEPLERFELIRRRAVRLVDLSYANPYARVNEQAKAAIREALDDERLLDLQYSPFGGQTMGFIEGLASVGYEVVHPDATLFIYARTPDGLEDFEFTAALAARGLLVLPAPIFHHEGYFRLSLTGSERMLEEALTILGQVIA